MFAGFDTSNYTTSIAFFDGENIVQQKKLLTVKKGERGLRQSEALFQHTVNLPDLISAMPSAERVDAVAVSATPRCVEGSYMPCFLAGVSAATAFAKSSGCLLYKTSHQTGHILAALYSAECLSYIKTPFLAFHVSGGTTEALLVRPDKEKIISIELVAESTDLKAGQLIDRTGVLLGLDFPCGAELEKLASKSSVKFKIKPSMQGVNCSLSGVENKVKAMIEKGESSEDTAKFVLDYVGVTVDTMTEKLLKEYGDLPLVYAGGVMSDSLIRRKIENKYNAKFAQPQYSCDNAAGIAVYAALKSGLVI